MRRKVQYKPGPPVLVKIRLCVIVRAPMRNLISALLISGITATRAFAQADGVPVYDETKPARADAAAKKAATELHKAGALTGFKTFAKQLEERKQCSLKLPTPGKEKLSSRELWDRARKSHLRVGWLFKDHEKPRWQISLSGGFAITTDGAVVTCYHVVEPHASEMKEGFLIAATDDERVFPVTEILAASRETDTCILRVKATDLTALPLNPEACPGDPVACFSDPMGRRGFYSISTVNRFVLHTVVPPKKKDSVPDVVPTFIEVGNDYAPGSSGAAVIDSFGNAVGHVSTIESLVDDQGDVSPKKRSLFPGTVIIFHDAISAKHVKELVKQP